MKKLILTMITMLSLNGAETVISNANDSHIKKHTVTYCVKDSYIRNYGSGEEKELAVAKFDHTCFKDYKLAEELFQKNLTFKMMKK